jgi:hypothetical protein
MIALAPAILPQLHYPVGEGFIIADDRASVTHGTQIFGRVKTKCPYVSHTAGRTIISG